MRAKHLAALLAAVMTVAALSVQAQQQPLTRAQVKAELELARASGELQRRNSDHMFEATLSQPDDRASGAQGRSHGSAARDAAASAVDVSLPLGDEGE